MRLSERAFELIIIVDYNRNPQSHILLLPLSFFRSAYFTFDIDGVLRAEFHYQGKLSLRLPITTTAIDAAGWFSSVSWF
jgi:hypothetical protein